MNIFKYGKVHALLVPSCEYNKNNNQNYYSNITNDGNEIKFTTSSSNENFDTDIR